MIVGSLAAGEASKSPDGMTLSSLTLTLLLLTDPLFSKNCPRFRPSSVHRGVFAVAVAFFTLL